MPGLAGDSFPRHVHGAENGGNSLPLLIAIGLLLVLASPAGRTRRPSITMDANTIDGTFAFNVTVTHLKPKD